MADEPTLDPALAVEGEEPVVEAPPEFTLPEDFAQQVQAWEIELDKLPEAVKTFKALQTEDGVIDAFISTGQALGFGLKELNSLFNDEPTPAPAAPAAPAAPVEPVDPEALMTRAEVDEMLAQVRSEQQQYVQSQQEREAAAKAAQVQAGIVSWFDTAGVEDDQTRRIIAQFGEKHVSPTADPNDIRVVTAALERGKADYEAYLEQEAQRYLKGKATAAASQPTPVGGAPAGSTGNEEAKVDYAAAGREAFSVARDRVRARLREAGQLS